MSLPRWGSRYVQSDPDGSLTAPKGTHVIDETTGVTYVNEDGATAWWPVIIPGRMGWSVEDDLVTTIISTYTNIGAGSWASTSGTAANPGQRTGTATAAGADGASIRAGGAGLFQLGGGKYRCRAILKLNALSDGVNNQIVRVGPGDGSTVFGDHTDGVYFEYDFATNGNHNWYACSRNNGTPTKTNTGIAATTNFTRFDLVINAACTAFDGKINGTATPQITTNLPSGAGRQLEAYCAVNNKQLGAGALSFTVDRIEANQILTTSR